MSIEKVQSVFRMVFGDDTLMIRPDMSASDVEGWDSFNHINLIVALEEEFELSFSTDEIARMANVGDLVSILRERGCPVSWS